MKIAVMGTGGVGGYFGAKLARNDDVTFIAHGAHLAAIKANVLRVSSSLGDVHLTDVKATANPGDVGPVDVVCSA